MEMFRTFPEQLHLLIIGHRQAYITDDTGERIKLKSFHVEYTNAIPGLCHDEYLEKAGRLPVSVRIEFHDGYVYVGWHRMHISLYTPMYEASRILSETVAFAYCQSGLKRMGYRILDSLVALRRRVKWTI